MGIQDTFGISGGAGSNTKREIEDLSSQANGIRTTFTVTETYKSKSLIVIWNTGVITVYSGITELSAKSFRLSATPQSGDSLVVIYDS